MKFYILATFITGFLFYSVYAFLDGDTVQRITQEDNLFEWITVLFFLGSSILSLVLFIKTRNWFFIIFCLAFFFAAGEEISWGQRLIGFETPEKLREKNIQNEFTLHNLKPFSRVDSNYNLKSGASRLLEFNLLFKVGTIFYGIVLPFLVFHFRWVRYLTKKIKLPVPPISVGMFFLFNWVVYRLINTSMPVYAARSGEVLESFGAFILFVISLFYYLERKRINYIGNDIKNSFEQYPAVSFLSSANHRGGGERNDNR